MRNFNSRYPSTVWEFAFKKPSRDKIIVFARRERSLHRQAVKTFKYDHWYEIYGNLVHQITCASFCIINEWPFTIEILLVLQQLEKSIFCVFRYLPKKIFATSHHYT